MPALTTTLTPRQNEIYQAVCASVAEKGMPPTLKELADRFGFNVNAAKDHVRSLVRKGYLRYTPNVSDRKSVV